ncbi:MAG TPA: hypothetical protein VN881_13975 [Candidatus Acidoferrales bacterium]|jgi:hypothetical protein|nr:hypothetical protein [Candidatus Acidoferrales bacterium]
MAEPAKARTSVGDNYPITINNLTPSETNCECDEGDTITFTATGQSCLLSFKGCALGIILETSNAAGITVSADAEDLVHWGVEAWTLGAGQRPVGGGSTPYTIHINTGDDGK